MISKNDHENAINTPLSVVKNIDLYEVDGRYLAERQDKILLLDMVWLHIKMVGLFIQP